MTGLTPAQRDLLQFISSYIAKHDIAPTVDEMRHQFGYASKSTIGYLLNGLQERGWIIRIPHKERSIEIVGRPQSSGLRSDIAAALAAHCREKGVSERVAINEAVAAWIGVA